jgi:uncharacterized coiled-coil protein SlyX
VRLPWWLNPWHEARELQHTAGGYEQRIDDLCETARMDMSTIAGQARTIAGLGDQLADSRHLVANLRGQLAAAVTDARTSGAAMATAQPEFVLAGTDRGPGRGKRIQVSRDIEVTAFAMTEMGDGEPRFKIGAIMARLLVIDKPTYGECLQYLATIWANQDRDAQASLSGRGRVTAVPEVIIERGEPGNAQDHL